MKAVAQQKKPTGKPAPIKLEDPELYFAFFRSHSAVDQQIQASSGAAAAQLSSATAALYGVSVSDLPKLTAQVRTFTSIWPHGRRKSRRTWLSSKPIRSCPT